MVEQPPRGDERPHLASEMLIDGPSRVRRCLGGLLLWAVVALMGACGSDGSDGSDGTDGTDGTGVTGCGTGPNAPVLTWDPVPALFSNLVGYRIYYGTSPGTYFQRIGEGIEVGAGTSYTVAGLSSGTYYFAATAYDMSDESVFSNEVCRTIP